MISAIPLMLLPLALYNLAMLGALGSGGIAVLTRTVVAVPMVSGAVWVMSMGDVLLLVALVVLFFELIKATRNTSGSLINHMLSLVVFIAALIEFLLVSAAATQVFFLMMAIIFIDVICGFAVSVRSAGRDVSIGL